MRNISSDCTILLYVMLSFVFLFQYKVMAKMKNIGISNEDNFILRINSEMKYSNTNSEMKHSITNSGLKQLW